MMHDASLNSGALTTWQMPSSPSCVGAEINLSSLSRAMPFQGTASQSFHSQHYHFKDRASSLRTCGGHTETSGTQEPFCTLFLVVSRNEETWFPESG